jgi:hypothetical protein
MFSVFKSMHNDTPYMLTIDSCAIVTRFRIKFVSKFLRALKSHVFDHTNEAYNLGFQPGRCTCGSMKPQPFYLWYLT